MASAVLSLKKVFREKQDLNAKKNAKARKRKYVFSSDDSD